MTALRSPSLRMLGLLGFLLVALTALGVTMGRLESPGEIKAFVAVAALAGFLYLLAVAVIVRTELPRGGLWLVLGVAVVLRLLVLPTQPFLSTDVFRYVWDGRVQAAGINPYLFEPADPALERLRDEAIYPNINRAATATTIYPPVAQWIFLAAAWLSDTVVAMKLTMVAFEVVAMAALMQLLPRAALPRERVLIYAWHPLPVWEFAGNGHVDAAALGLVALAWLAREQGRSALAGIALGAATLVKFLPACLLPALWRRPDLRLPLAFAALIVLAYLPYLGAGMGVLGYLPGYVDEENLLSGGGFYPLFLFKQLSGGLPGGAVPVYLAVWAILLAGLCLRIAIGGRNPSECGTVGRAHNLLLLGTAVTVALTPHHAWYFTILIPFLCVVPSPPVLYLTVASFGLHAQWIDPRKLTQALIYGPFLVLLLIQLWRRPRADAAPPATAEGRSYVGQVSRS